MHGEWLPDAFRKELKEPRKPLFHYTNQSGFLGILKEEAIWATHIRYLNDSKELSHSFEVAKQIIQQIRDYEQEAFARAKNCKHDDSGDLKRVDHELDMAFHDLSQVPLYVTCFTTQADSLSQWRGYSGVGGLAIGFDPKVLSEVSRVMGDSSEEFPPGTVRLGPCIYNRKLQEKILKAIITHKGDESDRINAYKVVGSFLKDSHFCEEKEWRLVAPFAGESLLRQGKSMLTPYVPLKLRHKDESFIRTVSVGPCPQMELSLASVQLSLRKERAHLVPYGSERVPDVRASRVPFRDW